MPSVFCMVIDVMTDTAYPPKDVMTLMSAWIPAPPEPSEPVIVNIVLRCFMLRRPWWCGTMRADCQIQRKTKKVSCTNIVLIMTMKRLFCASRDPAGKVNFSWQSLLHNSHIRSLTPLYPQIRPGFRVFVRCLCSVCYLFCQGILLSIAMLLPSNSIAFARQTHCFKRSMAWLFLTQSA